MTCESPYSLALMDRAAVTLARFLFFPALESHRPVSRLFEPRCADLSNGCDCDAYFKASTIPHGWSILSPQTYHPKKKRGELELNLVYRRPSF